ncbi:MAG: AraC family transcriptional regulator [Treponema sp.]|nr:AraC family transcriptional regulator [Treponema sp.]
MTKDKSSLLQVHQFSPDYYYEGNQSVPKEIGALKLLRQKGRSNIVYYDWDLSFVRDTYASRPDNFGKDEIQVIFNLNQPIKWQIDEGREKVSMAPGEVCVFRNKNYGTSMSYSSEIKFQFKSLQMETEYFENLLSSYFPQEKIEECKNIFLTHVTKTLITKDMYRVLSEIDSAEKFHEYKGIFLEAKMIELVALVLYGISYNYTEINPISQVVESDKDKNYISASKTDFAQVESLRRRIQFNPADNYKAVELAQSLSMSESKLTRLFRQIYGTSLHRYVQNQRLEKAASLITEGEVNISEAAVKSGYTNMSHFAKEFQKKFGVTPKKFSKKLQF